MTRVYELSGGNRPMPAALRGRRVVVGQLWYFSRRGWFK